MFKVNFYKLNIFRKLVHTYRRYNKISIGGIDVKKMTVKTSKEKPSKKKGSKYLVCVGKNF